MDKANIIISIIVVLCIAAAVAAYGITNSDSPIFSDLSSMGSNDDNGDGLGNNTTLTDGNTTGTSAGGSSVSSGSGSSSSGSSSSGSSSSGSHSKSGGSSSGSGSGSGSGSSTKTKLSYSTAKSIVTNAIQEEGCYAGSGYYSGGYWYFTVYDADGNAVDGIAVNDANGQTSRAWGLFLILFYFFEK